MDLTTPLQFPVHTIQTDACPHIVAWSNSKMSALLVKLTLSVAEWVLSSLSCVSVFGQSATHLWLCLWENKILSGARSRRRAA